MAVIDKLIAEALSDFRQVAILADAAFIADSIEVEILPTPHASPKKLPAGKMAVYAFFLNGRALKVGKVGPNSGPRYTSQHYNPDSAKSNLARSILLNTARVGTAGIVTATLGYWIKQNTDRVNLLTPASLGRPMLSLLESFLHVRWKPMFEGRDEGD